MKIGIFGGTFNPIHEGHLAIAEEVRNAVGLDKVLFIPAGVPPHKKDQEVIKAIHRLEMVRLAIENRPHFEVCDLEVERAGTSYTVDTVETLKKSYSEETIWFLMLGLDAFLGFNSWREPERLLDLCHFVVVSRPGFRFIEISRLPFVKSASSEKLARLDSSDESRSEFDLGISTQIILLRVQAWEVSATEIRSHLSGGKRRRNLLPLPVESYIIKNQLYSC